MKPILCLVLATVLTVLGACASEPRAETEAAGSAAAAASTADPLTGTWVGDWGPSTDHRNAVTLELSWDGNTLSGVANPGPNGIELSSTSFDPATGDVTMEANAQSFRGPVHYMIEGRVDGDTIAGSWTHDNNEGDFQITRN